MMNKLISIFSKNKLGRFVNSFIVKPKKRNGNCTPELCETLDGVKGAACCRLGYNCAFLCNTSCSIYNVRLRNCKVFPSNKEDLKLVKNCGYKFE